MRYFHRFSAGRDSAVKSLVANYTGRWIAFGVTSSPSHTGHGFGFMITDNNQKKVSDDPDEKKRFKRFRGLLLQSYFWWFKIYLYLFFDGDGRE